jgi:Rrf2 family protein
MKVSALEDFGLRCLLRIGREAPGGSLTIPELSQSEGISAANVGKIMRLLRRAGYVTSTRGQAGGYSLARPCDQIVVGDALAVLGGRLFEPGFCDRHAGFERLCTHSVDCSIRSLWRMVQGAVDEVLGKLTLKDLLCREQEVKAWPAAAVTLPTVPVPRPLG